MALDAIITKTLPQPITSRNPCLHQASWAGMETRARAVLDTGMSACPHPSQARPTEQVAEGLTGA